MVADLNEEKAAATAVSISDADGLNCVILCKPKIESQHISRIGAQLVLLNPNKAVDHQAGADK